MKELISHIEFLILQHECVIIPEFGGFVLNKSFAYKDKEENLCPPALHLGFNADLKFNDGLLASSYMKQYSISYDKACKRIKEEVKQLNKKLTSKGEIRIGKLGKLTQSEGVLSFLPDMNTWIHPNTWGLSKIRLPYISELEELQVSAPTIEDNRNRKPLRRVLIGVSSAAAVIALFALSVMNIDKFENIQQSGFFTEYTTNTGKQLTAEKVINSNNNLTINNFKKEDIAKVVIETGKEKPAVPVYIKKYFIIVGSETSKARGENILKKIQTEGFFNAGLVESPDRIRIYALSFTDKDKANNYLFQFREKYPNHKDAWLFSKRVQQ